MAKEIEYIALPDIERRIEESIHDSINFFNKLCPYCSNNLFSGHIRNKIHIDHFIPISKGGQNVPWNVLPVCQKCNSKKKDKRPEDYLGEEKYLLCYKYLKLIESKYVGNLQNDIERFLQIKSYLSKLKFSNITTNEVFHYFDNIYELIFDKKTEIFFSKNEPIKKPNTINSYEDELQIVKELFLSCFELSKSDQKTYKFTVTDIMKIIQKKCYFEIRMGMVSKVLKEHGLTPKLERLNSQESKRVVRLTLKP